jgi:lipopolysaccharide transport system ATP-binding protein
MGAESLIGCKMDALVQGENVSVTFPIFGSRSIKNTFISGLTGGYIKVVDNTVTVSALDNISFLFQKGERIGLWGQNGSGKTTLLRLIAGIYTPTSGKIAVNGSIASLLNISLGMDQEATGVENIYLRALMMGLTHKEIDEKMDEIIEYSELGEYINFPLKTYSTGMNMRLAFSISTAVSADIVLMDEWLSVGDVSFVEKAKKRLNDMLAQSSLLVLASHSRDILESTCTKILVLEHGKIVGGV